MDETIWNHSVGFFCGRGVGKVDSAADSGEYLQYEFYAEIEKAAICLWSIQQLFKRTQAAADFRHVRTRTQIKNTI